MVPTMRRKDTTTAGMKTGNRMVEERSVLLSVIILILDDRVSHRKTGKAPPKKVTAQC
jgi:hypothetical protein